MRQQHKQQQHKNQNLWYSNQLQDAGEEKNCVVFGHTACIRGEFTVQAWEETTCMTWRKWKDYIKQTDTCWNIVHFIRTLNH